MEAIYQWRVREDREVKILDWLMPYNEMKNLLASCPKIKEAEAIKGWMGKKIGWFDLHKEELTLKNQRNGE